MAGEHRRGADDDLLNELRELGADHEPDVRVIRQRIGVPASPATGSSRRARRSGSPGVVPAGGGSQSRVSVLLSTAALLLVVGGVVLVVRGPAGTVDSAAPTAATRATVSASPPPVTSGAAVGPGASAAPSTDAVVSTAAPTPSPPAAATTRPAPSRTGAGAGTGARISVSVDRPAAGTATDLSTPPLLDWVAVGTRRDLKQVRAKSRSADPVLTVVQPAGATSAAGEYLVSWDGGLPEQDHDRAPNWLTGPGAAGLQVAVAPSEAARTIVLYAGAADVDATLTVRGKGLTTTRTPLGTFTGSARAVVATVRLPASGKVTLSIDGTPAGPAPAVSLAAVTAAG